MVDAFGHYSPFRAGSVAIAAIPSDPLSVPHYCLMFIDSKIHFRMWIGEVTIT